MKIFTLIGILIALFVLTACTSQQADTSPTENPALDTFAQCLSENGAVMYGAYWCGHCKNQKEGFGDSFKFVNYVECDPRGDDSNPELCIEMEIDGYPTWGFADGSFLGGVQNFPSLAQKTGCEMPPRPDSLAASEDA